MTKLERIKFALLWNMKSKVIRNEYSENWGALKDTAYDFGVGIFSALFLPLELARLALTIPILILNAFYSAIFKGEKLDNLKSKTDGAK